MAKDYDLTKKVWNFYRGRGRRRRRPATVALMLIATVLFFVAAVTGSFVFAIRRTPIYTGDDPMYVPEK